MSSARRKILRGIFGDLLSFVYFVYFVEFAIAFLENACAKVVKGCACKF